MSRRLDLRRAPAERWTVSRRSGMDERVRQARDARIARALAALTARPAERWTVAKLARIAALSRAAFARRFAEEVGAPPLRHLTTVRMERAAELLRATDASLAEIAAVVGYANEFALSRAFRRHAGSPPGVYRRAFRRMEGSFAPRCLAA
jgi:transcriptional regulator GlxA family with amidase domain